MDSWSPITIDCFSWSPTLRLHWMVDCILEFVSNGLDLPDKGFCWNLQPVLAKMCRKDGLSYQVETVCLPFRKACFFQLVRNSSCFWYLLPALHIFLCKLSDQLFWTCALLSILCIRLNSDHHYTTVHVVDELSIAISWARGRCRSFSGLCYIYWPMLSGQPGLDSFFRSCSMTSECSIRFSH